MSIVAASGYEESALDLIAAMLSRCASWQTACGAADASGALARIVLRWGGDEATGQAQADATGYDDDGNPLDGGSLSAVTITGDEIELDDGMPWILLDESGPSSHTELAPGVWSVSGSASAIISIPAEPSDLPPELLRRPGNLAQTIMAEMKAQVGVYGSLYAARFGLERIQLEGALSARPNTATSQMTIEWGD